MRGGRCTLKKKLVKKPERERRLSRLDAAGMIIIRWVFKKYDDGARATSGYGQVVSYFGNDNEPLGSIQCKEFLA